MYDDRYSYELKVNKVHGCDVYNMEIHFVVANTDAYLECVFVCLVFDYPSWITNCEICIASNIDDLRKK